MQCRASSCPAVLLRPVVLFLPQVCGGHTLCAAGVFSADPEGLFAVADHQQHDQRHTPPATAAVCTTAAPIAALSAALLTWLTCAADAGLLFQH